MNVNALKAKNAQRWKDATLTRSFDSVAKRLVDKKARYRTVEKKTGVPWFIIAVIHERESSQSFARSLAQGDPWNRKSRHIPKGRGPFKSWEEAAIDALVDCAPYAARNKDWSVGGALALLEQYNGVGYAARNKPSPYLWAGTDQYVKGKFTSDGVYDPEHVDKQLGCAGMIQAMRTLDPSIGFGPPHEDAPPPPDIDPEPSTEPERILPEDGSQPAPKSMATSKIGNAQIATGAVTTVAVGAQVAKPFMETTTETVSAVSELATQTGTIVETTKVVTTAVPSGFWMKTVEALASPAFIACAVLIVIAVAGFTWYWRRQHRQAGA